MKRIFTLTILLFIILSTFAQQAKPHTAPKKPTTGAKKYPSKKHPVKKYPPSKMSASSGMSFSDMNTDDIIDSDDSDIEASSSYTGPVKVTGQWKGKFNDNTSAMFGLRDNIEYVLELETNGSTVTGYSYTYFSEAGKQYYTICKLKGTVNQATKEVVVTEFERTRFNTPPNFSNCFQTHRLKFNKPDGETEELKGTWVPAPNQEGNCGYGRTYLSRTVTANNALMRRKPTSTIVSANRRPPVTKPGNSTALRKRPVVTKPKINPVPKKKPQVVITDTSNEIAVQNIEQDPPRLQHSFSYKPRTKSVLQTFNVSADNITVEFYDNGEIDGDSISVFFNGRLIVAGLRLTDHAAKFTLPIDKNREVNELVMYAENLGTQPPNTALMVVTDGENKYEARITSDTVKSGTINFKYRRPE